MININLVSGEETKKIGRFCSWILTYGRYIIVGTEIIVLLAFVSRFKLDRDLTDLHESINQKQAIILAASDFENEVRTLQERLKIIERLDKQRVVPQGLLTSFGQLTPQDVILTDFSLDTTKLSLTAIALSNDGFTTFLNNLSTSSSFGDISLDDVGKARDGVGIEFKISMKLKGQ